MEIIQEKLENREEAFWYEGEIAKEGNCILIASGDIRVTFLNGEHHRDQQAVDYAIELGYTDKDLSNLNYDNNNWFEVISDTGESTMGDVAYTYDEGIELLLQYVREQIYQPKKINWIQC